MLLDLSRLREGHEHLHRTYAPSTFSGHDDPFTVAAPVELRLEVFKQGDQVRLVGGLRTILELSCSRCLESLQRPVDAAFDVLYLPHTANAGEGEVEIEDEDLSTGFYRDEVIDLGHLMREQFYLGLPMKPLCDEACRGLCPACGANRNTGSCECSDSWEDPRLAPLRRLLGRDR
jgi:uncharacterized protein